MCGTKVGCVANMFQTRKRKTSDMIFALETLFKKMWEWNEDRYITFIDLEKAFDRASRQKIWDALRG